MKKTVKTISNPDELNENLQYTSPFTWIILSISVFVLLGFFVWASLCKIKVKINGDASIKSGQAVLVIEDSNKEKIEVGQKVIIGDKEGTILSFEDNTAVVSSFDLTDGNYKYTIILDEIRPIEFLFNKK